MVLAGRGRALLGKARNGSRSPAVLHLTEFTPTPVNNHTTLGSRKLLASYPIGLHSP